MVGRRESRLNENPPILFIQQDLARVVPGASEELVDDITGD